MKTRSLVCFLLMAVAVLTLGARQIHKPAETAASSTPLESRWTEADRNELLAKAQRGDADAQMWLGAAYEQGWFGKTDFPEALKWFKRSAKHGNADAQNELGQMYEDGEGVKRNYASAAKWYRRAAEHVPNLGGAGQGRNNLGMLYLYGRGVPQDYVRAYMWFSLFGREANANLVSAKSHMTAAQVSQAERMARAWEKRHHDAQD